VTTVYCVDGTGAFREALSRIFMRISGLSQVGESASGRMALEEIRDLHPDIVILDNDLPDLNGFEVVKALRLSSVPCSIIMVSDHANPWVRETAIAAGVDFLLDKFMESQKIGPILETLVHLLPARGPEDHT
jgi:DNA-binding NarL/FixJ family response regulator